MFSLALRSSMLQQLDTAAMQTLVSVVCWAAAGGAVQQQPPIFSLQMGILVAAPGTGAHT